LRAIIGFDPGVTSGVAVLSLDGEVVFLKSFRNIGLDGIIGSISKISKPLIVATDVYPPANSASKLARRLGATLYHPTVSMTVAEKQTLTSGEEFGDLHQRDALASAISAYKAYLPMIGKIRQKSGSKYEMVFEKILKGKANRIEDALVEKIKLSMPEKPSSLKAQLETMKINRDHFAKKVEYLTKKNKELQSKLKQTKKELEKFRSETYKQVTIDKKVKALKTQLHNLQRNDRSLFNRVKLAEGKLEAIETWLLKRKGQLLRVEKDGEGLHLGELTLVEDGREKIEKIIKKHRSRKSRT
jgi:predicted RNase H-like nuclease (RuvC/YqgF family)